MVQRRKQDTSRRLPPSQDIRKLGIVTINLRRPLVMRLWLASIDRLRHDCGEFPVVCVSEKEDAPACLKHKVTHIEMENNPVSNKWNASFRFMQKQDVEYVMVLGSDDIMSSNYLSNVLTAIEHKPDVVYTKSIYFYDGDVGNVLYKYTDIYELGVGRCIHRNVLDQIDWTPYPKAYNFGMDGELKRRIFPYVRSRIEIDGMITDVKTRMNMNSIRVWERKGIVCSPDLFMGYLSEQEKEILARIKK